MISVIMIITVGMRVGGFDYNEYVTTIEILQSNSSSELGIAERLFIAKDPIMLGVVDFVGIFNQDETWPIFMSFAILGIATKTIAALTLNRYSAIFMAAYAVLLSHGLEFAAMRSSVAIGFVMLIVSRNNSLLRKLSLWVMAISSHISAVIFLISISFNRLAKSRRSILILLLASAITSYALSGFIASSERADGLTNNQGSLAAFFFPIATIVVFIAQLFSCIPAKNQTYGLIAIGLGVAFGLTEPAVTIAFRFMEMSWCLFLFAVFKDISEEQFAKGKYYAIFCCILFVMLLCAVIMVRSTWVALFTQLTFS
jgi:hypothetical protein